MRKTLSLLFYLSTSMPKENFKTTTTGISVILTDEGDVSSGGKNRHQVMNHVDFCAAIRGQN
jgi:hypothetical protein